MGHVAVAPLVHVDMAAPWRVVTLSNQWVDTVQVAAVQGEFPE